MSEQEIPQKGPYIEECEPGTYYWCSCAKSSDQPFCDGSHKGTQYSPLPHEVTTTETLGWCGCKRTKTPPFCDGTHNRL